MLVLTLGHCYTRTLGHCDLMTKYSSFCVGKEKLKLSQKNSDHYKPFDLCKLCLGALFVNLAMFILMMKLRAAPAQCQESLVLFL